MQGSHNSIMKGYNSVSSRAFDVTSYIRSTSYKNNIYIRSWSIIIIYIILRIDPNNIFSEMQSISRVAQNVRLMATVAIICMYVLLSFS